MDDLGFKLQNIKNRYWFRILLKVILTVFAIFIFILLTSKIFKIFFKSEQNQIETILLIKKQEKPIKRLPKSEGGLEVNNLDVSVYDVIDNQKKDLTNPVIQKIDQNIDIDKTNLTDEQIQLSEKIDEISNNEQYQIKNLNYDKRINGNITINKNEKDNISNIEELASLGNTALIKNLKNHKDIKPGIKVQILALRNSESLVSYWNELKTKYPSLFNDKNYYIEKTDLNQSGTIYRLQIGTFANNESANNFCQQYIKITNKTKLDCLIIND